MTSRTISSMSCISPSVRVIGSIDNFDALTFLHDPTCSIGIGASPVLKQFMGPHLPLLPQLLAHAKVTFGPCAPSWLPLTLLLLLLHFLV